MKAYTDIFNKPINKDDVVLAVRVITGYHKNPTASLLQRRLSWGYGKVSRVYELLEDAGVVGLQRSNTTRPLILKDAAQATNAALRQLKKGRK